jgi:hypothetical protein
LRPQRGARLWQPYLSGQGFEATGFLEILEGGKVLVGLAAQAAFLNAEVGKLALVSQIDVGLDPLPTDAFLLA